MKPRDFPLPGKLVHLVWMDAQSLQNDNVNADAALELSLGSHHPSPVHEFGVLAHVCAEQVTMLWMADAPGTINTRVQFSTIPTSCVVHVCLDISKCAVYKEAFSGTPADIEKMAERDCYGRR